VVGECGHEEDRPIEFLSARDLLEWPAVERRPLGPLKPGPMTPISDRGAAHHEPAWTAMIA
jgi:hypothetical protein